MRKLMLIAIAIAIFSLAIAGAAGAKTVAATKVKNTTSPTVAVKVRPRLRLRKLAPHRYPLRVFAARSFAGKYATFQRYDGALGRWINVKRILLRTNATGVTPTVISSVSFRSAIKPRLKVRVLAAAPGRHATGRAAVT